MTDTARTRSAVTLAGDSLTPEDVAGIVRDGRRVALSSEAKRRNEEAYELNLKLLESGAPVYGMNTGVGSLRSVEIPSELRDDYQRRLLRSHAVGAGSLCRMRSCAQCSRCGQTNSSPEARVCMPM